MVPPKFDYAESFFGRASNKLNEAREQLGKVHYPESISASQESMEFSLKTIFLYLEEQSPKTHEITDEQFLKIIGKIPKEIEQLIDCPRLLLISKFWSNFYTVSKYGNEKLGVGPEKLFKDKEAKLALEHAQECNMQARWLRDSVLRQHLKS